MSTRNRDRRPSRSVEEMWRAATSDVRNADSDTVVKKSIALVESHFSITSRSVEKREFSAHCPAHDDRNPSLSLKVTDEGRVLPNCHTGCPGTDVFKAAELETFRGFPIETTYTYHDEDGTPLHEVCRTVNKEFPVRSPGGEWGMGGRKRVLYRLPDLLEAMQNQPNTPIFVCEGEKDVDRCWKKGLIATCAIGGAKRKWQKNYSTTFGGRDVVILADNDLPGVELANRVAAELSSVAKSVKVIVFDHLQPHSDVSDFFDEGGTKKQLLKLVHETAEWTPQDEANTEDEPARESGARYTDLNNARQFSRMFRRKVRHCHPHGKFLVYDGIRWRPDDTGAVVEMAKEVADFRWEAAKKRGDEKAFNFAQRTASNRAIQAMLALARSEPGIPVRPQELDRFPMLLNCPNGTLDLETGKLQPHRASKLITQLCPTEYHSKAKAPLWEETLRRIFDGDEALIQFVQRFLGMSLTGDVSEQFFVILYGSGSNGKSLLLNVFMKVLGSDYSIKASDDLFITKFGQSHPTALADLCGKRFAVVMESDDDARLAEALIKGLTGGDRIRARRMREDFWEFEPTHKMVLCTNHKPRLRGTDHAIWRRIRFVPFNVTFWKSSDPTNRNKRLPKQLRADPGLEKKLLKEREGILAWCAQGCRDWLRHGIGESETVTAATNVYREEQDVLGRFIAERCKLDKAAKVKSGPLYARYRTWCESNGERVIPQNQFKEKLLNQVENVQHRRSDGSWYLGIALR